MGEDKKGRTRDGAMGRSAPTFSVEDDITESTRPVGTAAEPEVLDADRQPAGQPKALVRSGSLPGKSDLLQAYLTEIRHHPILDREEEKTWRCSTWRTRTPMPPSSWSPQTSDSW